MFKMYKNAEYPVQNNWNVQEKSNTQIMCFPQSNSSVYALYNDAPPVLDYIKGYGHAKGTTSASF